MLIHPLRVAVGQVHCEVHDLQGNLHQIEREAARARLQQSDLIVFPELTLSGYAVGDDFHRSAVRLGGPQVQQLARLSESIALAVGVIEETPDARFFNSALFFSNGRLIHVHRKVYLPTYGVFNEGRYFGRGQGVRAFDTPLGRFAMLICADAWHPPLPYLAAHDGADMLLVMAASPKRGVHDNIETHAAWRRLNQTHALTLGCFVAFANHGGAEGDLAYNGRSHLVGPDGGIIADSCTDEPDLVVGSFAPAALREQRIAMPFRRDDDLNLVVREGARIERERAFVPAASAEPAPDVAARIPGRPDAQPMVAMG